MTRNEMTAYVRHHYKNRHIRQIAEHLGITPQEVRALYDTCFNKPLSRYPEPPPDNLQDANPGYDPFAAKLHVPGSLYTRQRDSSHDEDVLRMKKEGMPLAKIAAACGISITTVYKILDNLGYVPPEPTYQRYSFVLRLVGAAPQSFAELSEKTTVDNRTLTYALSYFKRRGMLESVKEGKTVKYRRKA